MGSQPNAAVASAAGQASGIVKIPRILIVDLSVTASATGLPTILQIPADCDFEWWWTSIFRTDSRLKVLMKESATQRDMIVSGSPQTPAAFTGILVDNLAGLAASNAAFPQAVPYVMPASRNYQYLLTDTSAATNVFQMALHGYGLLSV